MRKILFFIVAIIIFATTSFSTSSCTDKKPASDTISSDSLIVDTASSDTLEDIISDTPMPKAADELFDDFIFNFAANKKLQRSRIQFPLPVYHGKSVEKLTAANWKTEHFFMHQDFYTLIFDNQRQMNLVKDTSIDNVIIEKIYLHKKKVRQYFFKRINGQWMMTSINVNGIYQNMNSSFLNFYRSFATDTAFQMRHINNPLNFTGPDPDDDFSTMSGVLAPEQWSSFAPQLPGGMIYNIIYGQKYTESNKKIFVIRGIANGLETELTFRRRNGKWMLMKLSM
jgi:hypothetical protein